MMIKNHMNLARLEENLMKILGCVWFCKIWEKIQDKEKKKEKVKGKKKVKEKKLSYNGSKDLPRKNKDISYVTHNSINMISSNHSVWMLDKKHKSIITWVIGRFEFIYIHSYSTSLYDIVIFIQKIVWFERRL